MVIKSGDNCRIRVLHLITGLYTGGAEMMLYKLLSVMDREKFEQFVISMIPDGTIRNRIENLGIDVFSLGMHRGKISLKAISDFRKILNKLNPDILQTWMYHADLLGGIVGRTISNLPVIWNIRHGDPGTGLDSLQTRLVIRTCGLFSRFLPRNIIFNSNNTLLAHVQLGYLKSKSIIIPNGFNTAKFTPDKEAYDSLRRNLGISADALVIGHVARYHPIKDHHTLIKAASLLLEKGRNVHFVLCGKDVNYSNSQLKLLINTFGLEKNFHLMDEQDNIEKIMAGFDIGTLTSLSEGFPNVIGEIMSCGVPFISTNVGDSKMIIGDTGITTPPKDPVVLSKALEKLLFSPKRVYTGKRARERIVNLFSIGKISKQYEKLYSSLNQERYQSNW